MDRKKPSLTSPWKVGFLVALLLVVMSLGASYFITGTFDVTWHWIHIGGLQPSTWTFNLGAFLEEMAPLLVLTALLAFAAYVLVAGAVRRYKAYVDSGVEYKQLLKSIKTIDDLDDADVLERLKQHPEIREFLIGIKRRVAAAAENHGERERKPAQTAASSSRDERPRLPSESALLATAIANGPHAFSRELALTVPELKQIERALRQHFADPANKAEATPATAPVVDSGEVDALRSSVLDAARAIRGDMEACAGGARELEVALTRLGAVAEGVAPAQKPVQNAAAVQSRIDATADALGALGEETRRIAIASALQASGGPDADVIKVADELRSLATKFNTVAQHWRETAPALKQLLAGGGNASPQSSDVVTEAVTIALSRARLWSERLIAMNERVRGLETMVHNGDAAPAHASAAKTDVTSTSPAPAAAPEPAFTSNASEDFITRGNREMFGTDDDTSVAFADIPFEKEHRFFADSPAEEADDHFVVDRADESRWDLSGDADKPAEPAAPAAPAANGTPVEQPAPAAPVADSGHDADGFLTGPRPKVSTRKIERKPGAAPELPRVQMTAPDPEPETASATATATLDPDADAIDLYELGAVDCVQTV